MTSLGRKLHSHLIMIALHNSTRVHATIGIILVAHFSGNTKHVISARWLANSNEVVSTFLVTFGA